MNEDHNSTEQDTDTMGAEKVRYRPLTLSNKANTFNFVSYEDSGNLMLSVTANENKKNGQFSSISLMPNEAHRLSCTIKQIVSGILRNSLDEIPTQTKVAVRSGASLVLSFENNQLSLYLNKSNHNTTYIRLDRFAANLIRMKANEHLCRLFDLPPNAVNEMLDFV